MGDAVSRERDVVVRLSAAVDEFTAAIDAAAAVTRRFVRSSWVAFEALNSARWSEALREGRRLREQAAATGRYGWPTDNPGTWAEEWRGGIPVGWISRP